MIAGFDGRTFTAAEAAGEIRENEITKVKTQNFEEVLCKFL
jgi:hypothetical protein